jgi:hypothetical protein
MGLCRLTSKIGTTNFGNVPAFNEFQAPTKIPFSQLSNFSGREDVLADLKRVLNPQLSGGGCSHHRVTVVLNGMGGIGKSQVALEYVYRNAKDYSTVFWVDATNSSTINASGRQIMTTLISHYATKYRSTPDFARIATELGIPGQIDAKGGMIDGPMTKSPWQIVRSWMSKAGNDKWCLIVDGINEPDVAILRDGHAFILYEILPACAHGHVIITSRMRLPGCEYHIEITEMDKESGLKLLVGSKLAGLAEDGRFCALLDTT